jgi:hypothetical protein
MKEFKQKLITQGHEAYPTIAKIVDALGEKIVSKNKWESYYLLDHEGITLIHSRNQDRASTSGKNMDFEGWIYKDYLFVTVGEVVELCPFRSQTVMSIHLDNKETYVTEEEAAREIFTPYHHDWYKKIIDLLPKAEAIINTAVNVKDEAEKLELSRQLFLDQNDVSIGG